MRLVVLFVGLLCILFMNSKGYSTEHTHQRVSENTNISYFESGHDEAIWGFEKTESNSYNANDTQIQQGKKRNTNSIPGFSGVTTFNAPYFKNYNPVLGSHANRVQHYHSSQSLLQVFLL